MNETILVTGGSGFIGFHLCKKLIRDNKNVISIDNMNNYYDVTLKKDRLDELNKLNGSFKFLNIDIENIEELDNIFKNHHPTIVVNLAAQAGVRYSIENPNIFIKSNILGFGNLLESCKKYSIKHLIYASSSSVYGGNKKLPYSENNIVDHPVSLYAATKKSNELMAHTYSHLYNLPATGLRFFTVYGPWGRPDMSYYLFTKAIFKGETIDVFNYGNMQRDFTYIDDIIESLKRVIDKVPQPSEFFDFQNPDISQSWAPHKIFNIGNSNSINLNQFIEIIEEVIGKKANKNFIDMPKGDVQSTLADTSLLEEWIKFKPSTELKDGYKKFYKWFKEYYQI
tara:strand:+ start:463 stop:1479 length:1017 start_codon:yes stop_codon:yes gene_type:complete